MATKEDNRLFIDANVLVYAAVSQSPFHAEARRAIHAQQTAGAELWISRQVLREYLATLSRPQTFSLPQPSEVLAEDVRRFESSFSIAEDGPAVTSKLLELLETHLVGGKQIHDANIVATMLTYDIRAILTHNADDYARFVGLITVLPLVPSAPSASGHNL
jgi:predicted nucleic acid-binding protein